MWFPLLITVMGTEITLSPRSNSLGIFTPVYAKWRRRKCGAVLPIDGIKKTYTQIIISIQAGMCTTLKLHTNDRGLVYVTAWLLPLRYIASSRNAHIGSACLVLPSSAPIREIGSISLSHLLCKWRPAFTWISWGPQGRIYKKARGWAGSNPLRSDGSQHSQAGRLDRVGHRQLKWGHQARVNLDQTVLMMVRQGGWTTWVVAKRHSKLN